MRRNDGSGEHERLVGLGKDFWSLFQGLGDAAYLIETSTGKILAANAQAAAQTGYSTDELVGMNIVDDLSVDPPPVSLEEVKKRFSRGKTVRFVHKKRRKDGSIYWDEVTVAPLPFPGIHVSLNRDITEQINKEKFIQQEQSQLRAIFDSINAIIYVADPYTHEILYINKYFRDMIGKNPVGRLCYEEFQGRSEPCEFCTNDIILKNKGKPYQWEYHNPVYDRDYLIVDRIITWPDGRDVRFEVAFDITEQKAVAEELREREELYKALFEQLSDALFLESLDGKILAVNESACRLLGYSRDELTRLTVGDLVPEGGKKFLPELIDEETMAGKALETVNRRKDGTLVPVELRGRIIEIHGAKRMLVSLRDISARVRVRRVEEILQRITEAANAAENLDSLFSKIREILSVMMDTTNFRIALYDEKENTIFMPYMVDEKDTYHSFVAANSSTAYVIKSGRPLLITARNRAQLTKELGLEPVGTLAKAWLGVPLRVEDRVVGAVVVQSYTDPDAYGDDDIGILETVSDQIAMAIVRERAREALRESEARYRSIFSATTDAILVFDQDGNIVEANPAAYRMYGYAEGELIGLSADKIVHPDYYHGFKNFKNGINAGVFVSDSVNLRKDGTPFPVEVHGVGFIFQGEPHLLSITRDISARIAAEKELEKSQRKIELLHDVAHVLESLEDEEEVYTHTVHAAEEILGFPLCTLDIREGDALVTKATSKGLPAGASQSVALSEESLATKTYRTGKTYVINKIEDDTAARPTRTDFRSGISVPIGKFGVFQVAAREENAFSPEDVRLLELLIGHTTQAIGRIRLQRELREQAIRDPLTGVYNRRYFNEVVERELVRAKRYDHPIGFLMIDVDGFKAINDRFGHQTGDKILRAVADLLVAQVRETDLVVRYGGDEFLVMLIETNGQTEAITKRIQDAVAARNKTNKLIPIPVTLSIGAAHWSPGDDLPIEQVLARADQAMYREKRTDG